MQKLHVCGKYVDILYYLYGMPNQKMNCKLCNEPTIAIVNIDFKAIPVCNHCSNAIFLQQSEWLAKREFQRIQKEGK